MPKFPESAFCKRSPDFRALKSKLAKEVTAHLEILNSPGVKQVDPTLFESALRSLKNGSVQESATRRITHEADLKAQEELNKIPGLEAQTDKGAAFWKKVCDQKIAKEKEIALKLKEITGAGADSGKPEFHEKIAAIYEKVRTSASEYSGFIEKGMQEWKSEMSRKEGQARRVVTGNAPAQTAALRERYSEELTQWRLDRYILKDFFQELMDEEHTYKMFGFDAHDMVRGANACSASMSTQ